MAVFNDLPPEIVGLVLSYRQSRRELLALSYVCKSLHKSTNPVLYKEISIEWGEPSLYRLFGSLLKRPKLASYVWLIRFICPARTQDSRDPTWGHDGRLEEEVSQLGRDLVLTAQLPCPKDWVQDLEQGHYLAIVALLIAQLHKVKYLEVGERFQSNHLGAMFDHALSPRVPTIAGISSFQCLERVVYSPEQRFPMPNMIAIDSMTSLFRLPSIHSLSALAVDTDSFLSHEPLESKLTALDLHHSHIREDTLKQLLAMTPNLKSLKCGLWIDAEPHDNHSSFLDCEALGEALKQVRCLEHLAVSVKFFATVAMEVDSGGAIENGEHWGISGSVGSLTSFTQLESLEVPFVVLLGWVSPPTGPRLADILPPNLRHLLLSNDLNFFHKYEWNQESCRYQLSEYLDDFKAHTPKLEELTVTLRDCAPDERWDDDTRHELELLCQQVGISCIIEPPSLWF